jgi:hypothetical protein
MTAKVNGDFPYLPEQYRETFQLLYGEYLEITEKAREYEQLYGDEKLVRLLNDTAPFLFWLIQNTFYDDLILSLARLLDPARTLGNENMSLCYLIDLLKTNQHCKLASRLETRLEKIKTDAKPIVLHRKKRIAHNGRAEAITDKQTLPGVSWNIIKKAIGDACSFLSEFDREFTGSGIQERPFDDCRGAICLWDYFTKARAYDDFVSRGKIPLDYHAKLAKEQGFF